MTTIVVGGSNRGVGKTALVCGLIAALPEFRWTAIKITSHDHGQPQPLWEETQPGQGTDTARYLAAGAARSLLVTAGPEELDQLVPHLLQSHEQQQNQPQRPNLIFESNCILQYLQPDLCLAVEAPAAAHPKPSFALLLDNADALVVQSAADRMSPVAESPRPIVHLAALDRISPEMHSWLRSKLQPKP